MSGKCQWFYCNGFHIVMFKMSEIVEINTAYYQNDGLVTETVQLMNSFSPHPFCVL